MSQSNDNACKSSGYQGCETGTQILVSGSGHLNFLAPAPKQFDPKNQKKAIYYLYTSLAPQTIYVDPEPKFPAPAIQNCFGSGSTDLLRTRLIHICLSYWTIYRSFESILKRGTACWIGLQIQCSIQIHCFKKHSVRYELL